MKTITFKEIHEILNLFSPIEDFTITQKNNALRAWVGNDLTGVFDALGLLTKDWTTEELNQIEEKISRDIG